MQQAARVSDRTAFFNLDGVGQPGRLIEMADTHKIFTNPPTSAPRTTSPAASADPDDRRQPPATTTAAAGDVVATRSAPEAYRWTFRLDGT